MIGLGIAFLVALALMSGGSKSAAAPSPGGAPPPPPPPDLPPVTPSPPDPSKLQQQTRGKSGTMWLTQPAGQNAATGQIYVDIFLPDGQLGQHPTFRVLRYSQEKSGSRAFMEAAPGVDPKILALAISDFSIAVAGKGPIDVSNMSPDLQKKLADALAALTVSLDGKVVGPVTVAGIQLATAVAGELERAGFGAAATALRELVKQAQAMLPPPPANQTIPLPPAIPADLQAKINQALQTERDPAKLTLILNALKAYQPQTPELVNAEKLLEALIIQIKAQQSTAAALTQVDQIVNAPAPPPAPAPAPAPPAAAPAPSPVPAPAPVAAKPPTPAPVPAAVHQYTVQAEDGKRGPSGLAADFTGNGNRWTELKALNPKYDLTKQWWVGMVINLPASWPLQKRTAAAPAAPIAPAPAPAPVHSLPEMPESVPIVATPQPTPVPKTPLELAADAVVRNLKAVQAKYGMPAAHGKEDKMLVSRFQSLCHKTADGLAGPGTFVDLATYGQSDLPLVMYWPKVSNAQTVYTYRQNLQALADKSRAAGDLTAAATLEASAAREHGEGVISTGQLVP
jgi:hypothetical protein